MKTPVPELTPLDINLLTCLRDYHRGRASAVLQKHLQASFSREVSLRQLRASHERLVANLYPVGVSNLGYYYEVDAADRRATRHYRLRKIIAMLRSEKRARYAWEAEQDRKQRGRVAEQLQAVRMVVGRGGQCEMVVA